MKHPSRCSRLALFTIATWLALPLVAQADRVVLYHLGGSAEPEFIEDVERQVTATLQALGHEVVGPAGGVGATRPETAAQMGGIATAASADWVLLIDVEPLRGQYLLHIFAGYQATQRVEELTVNVLVAEQDERLRDILATMLREEGLGMDALRLTGQESDAEQARREAEERARAEAEAAALAAEEAEARRLEEEAAERERLAEEARQREAAEAAAQDAQTRWDARPQYGSDGHWMLSVGGGASAAIGFAPLPRQTSAPVGGLGLIEARVAHQLEGVGGLELRGGVDVFLGSTSGMDIVVGAAYLFSPFVEPIYIGAVIELGVAFGFTGARDVGFVTRASAIIAWRPVDHFQLEVVLPEIGVMTNGVGSLLVGGALRAGYRF